MKDEAQLIETIVAEVDLGKFNRIKVLDYRPFEQDEQSENAVLLATYTGKYRLVHVYRWPDDDNRWSINQTNITFVPDPENDAERAEINVDHDEMFDHKPTPEEIRDFIQDCHR